MALHEPVPYSCRDAISREAALRESSGTMAGLVALAASLLAGCQPTTEERLASAGDYLADGQYRSAVIELKNVLQAEPDSAEARLMLADASFVLADLEAAESHYERFVALGTATNEHWVAFGRTLLTNGKAAEVLEVVEPQLADDDIDALVLLGDTHLALNNADEASARYESALSISDSNVGALVGMAALSVVQGDFSAAGLRYDQAVAADPASVLAQRSRGIFLESTGRFELAVEAYQLAVGAETAGTPAFERFLTRQNLIALLIELNELDRAASELDTLSAITPGAPVLTFFRGAIAFARNDYETAETEMLRYLAVVPDDPRAQAVLGAIGFSENNLLQAEQYLSSAVRANVGGSQARLMLAETQLKLGKPGEAERSLDAVDQSGSSGAVVLDMLGRAKLAEGDIDSAIAYFRDSLQAGGPTDATGLALAISYVASGSYDEAIQTLTSLPSSEGDETYRKEVLLMIAYSRAGRSQDADAVVNSLVTEHPDSANALGIAGDYFVFAGDGSRARASYRQALDIDPDNAAVLISMGRALAMEGDFDEAATAVERVLATEPAHVPALFQLAAICEQAETPDKMLTRLSAARSAAPESADVAKIGIRWLLTQANIEGAKTEVDQAIRTFPGDEGFVFLRGLISLQQNDPGPAVRDLSRVANSAPENPDFQLQHARARLANREFSEALVAVRQYRDLRPNDVSGLALEVDALLRTGDPATARRAVDAFAAGEPDEPFLDMLRGDLAMASGDGAAAVQFYESYAADHWGRLVVVRLAAAHQSAGSGRGSDSVRRWVNEHPTDITMRRLLGLVLEGEGRSGEAIEQFESLIDEGNNDPVALNNLAWHYMLEGRSDAIDLARRAHELAPENGSIADTFGWILLQQGQVDAAVDTLRQASELQPENPEIRYHLGAALAEAGRTDEARRVVEDLLSAQQSFPSRTDAEALLATL